MSDSNNVELTQEQKDAALAEKFRAQANGGKPDGEATNDEGNKPQRPEHIPEKFWDAEKGEVRVEELAKSYVELEKGKEKPADGAKPNDGDAAAAADADLAAFAEMRQNITAQISEGKEITGDQYAALEKRGLSREDVDTFVAGLEAIGKLAAHEVHSEAGGKDAYDGMIAWAKGVYSPAEVEAYDRDVYSRDAAVRMNAVRGLKARYEAANGRDGKSVTHGARSIATGEGYKSRGEMVKDMADPRYAKDASFREEVAKKVAAAAKSGVNLYV